MANEEIEPIDLSLNSSLKRKRKKEAVEAVEKVSMPKADLNVAGFRAHDNCGNKYIFEGFNRWKMVFKL